MRIATVLNGAIAILSTITIGISAWVAYDAANRHTHAQQARQMVERLAMQAQLVEAIALERSPYSAVLAGDNPASPTLREEGAKRRASVDALLARLQESLAQMQPAEQALHQRGIQAQRSELEAARALADGGFNKPRQERAANIAEQFVTRLAAMTQQARNAMSQLETSITRHDAEIAKVIPLISLSTDLRDIAGQRSAWLSQYVASRKQLSPETMARIHEANGRADYVWAVIERVASMAGTTPAQSEVLDSTRKRFWIEGSTRYAQVARAGQEGTDPGMTIETWRPWTLEALGAIMKLRDAAITRAQEESAQSVEQAYTVLVWALGGVLLAALLAGSAIFMIRRRVVLPLTRLSGAIANVAQGNFNVDLPKARHNDEIEEICRAVDILAGQSREAETLRARQSEERLNAEQERQRYLAAVADQCQQAIGGAITAVRGAAGELEANAISMSDDLRISTRHAEDALGLSREAAGNVSAVAAAAEELSASVRETGIRVQESSELARIVSSEVEATSSKMGRLDEASRRISDILSMITQIAGQTNLLALNATIEAARAGEAGKGFAVVASEVKTLAAQTASATAEISQQIGEVQAAASDAMTALAAVVETFRNMDTISASVACAVREQGEATQEIATNISNAAQHTDNALGEVSGAHGAVGKTGNSAYLVLESAAHLNAQSAVMEKALTELVSTLKRQA